MKRQWATSISARRWEVQARRQGVMGTPVCVALPMDLLASGACGGPGQVVWAPLRVVSLSGGTSHGCASGNVLDRDVSLGNAGLQRIATMSCRAIGRRLSIICALAQRNIKAMPALPAAHPWKWFAQRHQPAFPARRSNRRWPYKRQGELEETSVWWLIPSLGF